jgi:hypothetical protein
MVAVVKEKFKYDDALDAFGALYGRVFKIRIKNPV